MPERLDLTLEPAAARWRPRDGASIKVAAAISMVRPPPASRSKARSSSSRRRRTLEGFPGYRSAWPTRRSAACASRSRTCRAPDADGKADVAGRCRDPRTARPLEADVIVRLREPGGRTIERNVTLPVDPALPRIGIKPLFARQGVGEGETAASRSCCSTRRASAAAARASRGSSCASTAAGSGTAATAPGTTSR